MIRPVVSILLVQAFLFCSGQDSAITDGPHLFYKNSYLHIESVYNNQVKKDSMEYHSGKAPHLSVAVPGQPGVFFSVPLKMNLNPEAATYPSPERLFVLSDIEGKFQAFYKLLLAGRVIDDQFNWTFGKGHLVLCGDMFDRGADVTPCLWLLYKLEAEAKAKGGYVHVVLGNHEIMNLSEDFSYVHPKYLKAAVLLGKTYQEFYTINTELGRWLRTKNIIERIGDFLFLHAGVSQAVNESGLSLKQINNRVRSFYDMYGYDSILAKGNVALFFNGNSSPFWYRGYFLEPRASRAQIDSTLHLYKVKQIVVGHTIVDSIRTLYDGKIIAIDVNYHTGNQQALLIEKDGMFRMNEAGEKKRLH
jgi:hypothetical protein